ncbi:hypothetical protein [Amycolatopsis sp. NPDC051061]|uniref:hypothetical protein n=1 Tax=Amycolatopsis sp. NPDC051061 TaxID=3155042 RepID=UPI00343FC2C8
MFTDRQDCLKATASTESAIAQVERGLNYPSAYFILSRALRVIEGSKYARRPATQHLLTRGTLALARTSRQLDRMPSVTAGHYRLAAKLAYRLGDYQITAPALLGQALTWQESDPGRAKKILLDVEHFISNHAIYDQRVSWRVRVAGVMRNFGQFDDAVRYHRNQVNPLLHSGHLNSLEFYIQQNSWAATLIEQGKYLDEAYYAIGDIGQPIDTLALHDRNIQLVRLYAKSRDWQLAEHHYQLAFKLNQQNTYDATKIIESRLLLEKSI